jgi:hypothetical protein
MGRARPFATQGRGPPASAALTAPQGAMTSRWIVHGAGPRSRPVPEDERASVALLEVS